MFPPATPANEPQRLARLRALRVLDTLPERAFDDIAALAQTLCDTPIALISFIDEDRQWFKSRIGVPDEQTPRASAFCAHAILTPERVMVIEDMAADARFAGSPLAQLLGGTGFYAGAPIVTRDGLALGTLCVIDHQPRQITEVQVTSLKRLADIVSDLLEHEGVRRLEQEQTERDTATRNARLTAMTAAGMDLQAFIDPDGIYRHVNDTYLEYNGCAASDVIGRHVAEHVGEALYRDVVGRQLARALSGESVLYQRQADFKGRGKRHMEVALLPVREVDGKLAGVVLRGRDIEVLKRNESRLNAAVNQLERKTLEQQRLIHMLSHDLREPVNAVNNFSSLLLEEHAQSLPATAHRHLGFVREGGLRISRLIDGLATYAQLDDHALRLEPVDTAEIVRQVREALDGELTTCAGRIEVGSLPIIMADANLLRMALHQLIGNALKFARPGVPPVVQVKATQDEALDMLHVTDNGVGIAHEHHGNIFGLFTRLHNRREYDGAGLGLAICQRVADLHRGRLSLQSEPRQGSCFTLHLPAAAGPA
ncbi:MAG: PAS domain-containing protein [Hydrogenophaga sp.]|uniref:sensor histidine kinase n=1 Tax=Hydrogenophaga sp. TaxID=1904254 RepID=UPI001DD0CB29|nr:ATP-binding protein [Hydrogenophaga sp.]MBX3611487.1 PAS domain-containing protein [Hydrogenophaga sp.]